MKNWTSLFTLIGIFTFGNICSAQDYNDIGRTKKQEFEILKYNGFNVQKIRSEDVKNEIYIAKRLKSDARYENIISINKKSGLVTSVIWNFDAKNTEWIKSLLSDMIATDSSYSNLENKKGFALLTVNPYKEGNSMVVWKRKSKEEIELPSKITFNAIFTDIDTVRTSF